MLKLLVLICSTENFTNLSFEYSRERRRACKQAEVLESAAVASWWTPAVYLAVDPEILHFLIDVRECKVSHSGDSAVNYTIYGHATCIYMYLYMYTHTLLMLGCFLILTSCVVQN